MLIERAQQEMPERPIAVKGGGAMRRAITPPLIVNARKAEVMEGEGEVQPERPIAVKGGGAIQRAMRSAMASAAGVTDRRFKGIVKNYSCRKGYGFIDCKELHGRFKKDIYVHWNQILQFVVGDHVSFGIMLNQNNQPQAVNLKSE